MTGYFENKEKDRKQKMLSLLKRAKQFNLLGAVGIGIQIVVILTGYIFHLPFAITLGITCAGIGLLIYSRLEVRSIMEEYYELKGDDEKEKWR